MVEKGNDNSMCLLVINDGKYLLLVLCLTLLLLEEYTWVQFISREKIHKINIFSLILSPKGLSDFNTKVFLQLCIGLLLLLYVVNIKLYL